MAFQTFLKTHKLLTFAYCNEKGRFLAYCVKKQSIAFYQFDLKGYKDIKASNIILASCSLDSHPAGEVEQLIYYFL